MDRLYPKATHDRLRLRDRGYRRGAVFFRAAAKNFLLLQVLFLGLFAWVFGALFQQTEHIHNLHIAFVDYDQGAVGAAVRSAYARLADTSFPTLEEQPASRYPAPASDLRRAVCSTDYWGAVYVTEGASERLQAALASSDGDNLQYDPDDVFRYVWNEAIYPMVVDAAIQGSIEQLANQARIAYANDSSEASPIPYPLGSRAAAAVLANPWNAVGDDIQPTSQGSRAIYNTLVIILILIQEFFYLGTINGLHASFKIYNRIHPHRVLVVRSVTSLSYTLVGSLCTAGAIWAFRAGWNVDGGQFAATWMVLWLFAHLNFLTLDVFTIWLPLAYVPMSLAAWIVTNVTSILLPFQLSAGFYHVGYAFPAHDVYEVLLDIWSGGCFRPQLKIALPILFAYEIVSFVLSAVGIFRRSHYAALGEEAQAREFRERVDAAMAFEQERADRQDAAAKDAQDTAGDGGEADSAAAARDQHLQRATTRTAESDEALRHELEQAMSREDSQGRLERQRTSRAGHFGPSFDLPFVPDEEGDEDGQGERDEEEGARRHLEQVLSHRRTEAGEPSAKTDH